MADSTGSRGSSRRPARADGMTYLNSTLPTALVDRLDEECKTRIVGRNFIVRRALDEFFERLDAQEERP